MHKEQLDDVYVDNTFSCTKRCYFLRNATVLDIGLYVTRRDSWENIDDISPNLGKKDSQYNHYHFTKMIILTVYLLSVEKQVLVKF